MDGYEGIRQARVLRVFVFHNAPEFLLLYLPSGMSMLMPERLAAPFTHQSVKKEFATANMDFRISEATAGRWTQAMAKAKAAEKSEANQRQGMALAAQSKILLNANSDVVRDRARANLRKQEVDTEIRSLKSKIGVAKANAYQHGEYIDRKTFREMEEQLSLLIQESQGIQNLFATLRKQEAQENREVEEAHKKTFNEVFRIKAKALLPHETYLEIRRIANAECEDDYEIDEAGAVPE